eukprot:TRINITY_DN65442_c0_g1_i1.p1 TRINITY_DN65442_c0_g1~~TRINITY_DN65442_c0_g1_i1.p1  ORF type:complete len:1294 (+),score=416.99 TRINITY_DN65442_c0_g1_i1:78-3959(+)
MAKSGKKQKGKAQRAPKDPPAAAPERGHMVLNDIDAGMSARAQKLIKESRLRFQLKTEKGARNQEAAAAATEWFETNLAGMQPPLAQKDENQLRRTWQHFLETFGGMPPKGPAVAAELVGRGPASVLRPGDWVVADDLVGRTDLNGHQGRLVEWLRDVERWVVNFPWLPDGPEECRIRPRNLIKDGDDKNPQKLLQTGWTAVNQAKWSEAETNFFRALRAARGGEQLVLSLHAVSSAVTSLGYSLDTAALQPSPDMSLPPLIRRVLSVFRTCPFTHSTRPDIICPGLLCEFVKLMRRIYLTNNCTGPPEEYEQSNRSCTPKASFVSVPFKKLPALLKQGLKGRKPCRRPLATCRGQYNHGRGPCESGSVIVLGLVLPGVCFTEGLETALEVRGVPKKLHSVFYKLCTAGLPEKAPMDIYDVTLSDLLGQRKEEQYGGGTVGREEAEDALRCIQQSDPPPVPGYNSRLTSPYISGTMSLYEPYSLLPVFIVGDSDWDRLLSITHLLASMLVNMCISDPDNLPNPAEKPPVSLGDPVLQVARGVYEALMQYKAAAGSAAAFDKLMGLMAPVHKLQDFVVLQCEFGLSYRHVEGGCLKYLFDTILSPEHLAALKAQLLQQGIDYGITPPPEGTVLDEATERRMAEEAAAFRAVQEKATESMSKEWERNVKATPSGGLCTLQRGLQLVPLRPPGPNWVDVRTLKRSQEQMDADLATDEHKVVGANAVLRPLPASGLQQIKEMGSQEQQSGMYGFKDCDGRQEVRAAAQVVIVDSEGINAGVPNAGHPSVQARELQKGSLAVVHSTFYSVGEQWAMVTKEPTEEAVTIERVKTGDTSWSCGVVCVDLLVQDLAVNGPADKAGLIPGACIWAVNGRRARQDDELQQLLTMGTQRKVTLTIRWQPQQVKCTRLRVLQAAPSFGWESRSNYMRWYHMVCPSHVKEAPIRVCIMAHPGYLAKGRKANPRPWVIAIPAGDGDRPSDWYESWRAEHRGWVCAVPLVPPGCNQSLWATASPEFVQWLPRRLLADFAVEGARFHLVGHSSSAAVSWAVQQPGLWHSLTLLQGTVLPSAQHLIHRMYGLPVAIYVPERKEPPRNPKAAADGEQYDGREAFRMLLVAQHQPTPDLIYCPEASHDELSRRIVVDSFWGHLEKRRPVQLHPMVEPCWWQDAREMRLVRAHWAEACPEARYKLRKEWKVFFGHDDTHMMPPDSPLSDTFGASAAKERCPKCRGCGVLDTVPASVPDPISGLRHNWEQQWALCSDCGGSGEVDAAPLPPKFRARPPAGGAAPAAAQPGCRWQ